MTSASLVHYNVLYCIIDFKHLVYFAIFLGSIVILRSPINRSRVLVRDMFTNCLPVSYKKHLHEFLATGLKRIYITTHLHTF